MSLRNLYFGGTIFYQGGYCATQKSFHDWSIIRRKKGTGQKGIEIYVIVFFCNSIKNDSSCRTRHWKWWNCSSTWHSSRNRFKVAQALFWKTIGRPWWWMSSRSAPGFSPQNWSCKLRLWLVNSHRHGVCPFLASVLLTLPCILRDRDL